MIKILIADDFPIVRKGLKETLEERGGFKIVDEVSDGSEVLKLIREKKYDVVLMDISMPGRSGLDILIDIKKIKPDLPVLLISMYPEEDYAVRALKSGASGYVTKTTTAAELIEAVNRVASGRKYVSENLAENMALLLERDVDDQPHKNLSDREFEVFCKLAAGQPVSAIADEMSLSVKTISTYRSRIMEKMNMESNAELAIYAVRNNLIQK
ncbi:MAG: response regulator transcription factor [Candidatus Omnitrophica bacterium]|nr:response regulator transcription factor [Candidatus Omnitrophota bacterium]